MFFATLSSRLSTHTSWPSVSSSITLAGSQFSNLCELYCPRDHQGQQLGGRMRKDSACRIGAEKSEHSIPCVPVCPILAWSSQWVFVNFAKNTEDVRSRQCVCKNAYKLDLITWHESRYKVWSFLMQFPLLITKCLRSGIYSDTLDEKKIGDLRLNCDVQRNLWFITLGLGDRASPYCPIWPETLCIDQAGFDFTEIYLPLTPFQVMGLKECIIIPRSWRRKK